MPAMNDDAVYPPDRVALIAAKHRSHRVYDCLLEPGLPAMNDDAVRPPDRIAKFAGKHRSHRVYDCLLEPGLPAMNDDAVSLAMANLFAPARV